MFIRKIKNNFKESINKASGFTLVEMAISLMIVGIITASAFTIYTQYLTNKQETATLKAVSAVTTAINEFKNVNGRFPCPAPILEPKDTSPNYGRETNCADPTITTGSVVAPGTCLDGTIGPNNYNGICVEASTRLISGVNPRVRVGSIPFRDLQIDEKETIDGYGSRLVYAVTENMAVSATYNDTIAGIELRDGAGNILSNNAQSLAFVVLSPGRNRNGAVSVAGVPLPCAAAATDLDSGNCRDFTTTTNTQAIYVMDAQASGTNQFDDIVEYFIPSGAEVWRRATATSEDLIDMSDDRVGVGITNPAQLTDDLTVRQSTVTNDALSSTRANLTATNTLGGNNQSGALRIGRADASNVQGVGKILADSFCDENGANCFSTAVIAGPYDGDPLTGTSGMGCPAGQYMIGIEAGRAKCGDVQITCPAGQAITGFSISGAPNCQVVSQGCVNESKNLCGTPYTLLATGHGQFQKLDYNVGGACAFRWWQCNNGSWITNNASAAWGFDSVAACSYTNTPMPTGSVSGQSCGTGFTGTFTQNFNILCNGNRQNTTNTFAADCVCQGITENVFCGVEYGGNLIGTRQRVCTNNSLGGAFTVFTDTGGTTYGSEAAMIAAKCACTKGEHWHTNGTVPNMVRKNPPNPLSFVNPVANWDPNPAACGFRRITVNAANCTWIVPGYDTSNCECVAGTQNRFQDPVCTACENVATQTSIRQIRSQANSCNWIDDPTNTPGNGIVLGTCSPKTFIWKSSGVPSGPSLANNPGYPRCGSSCNCGQVALSTTCATFQNNTQQYDFFRSDCQPL